MSNSNYHASREASIKNKSDEILAGLPEAAKESARLSRQQLFSWLVQMDSDLKNVGALATDALADFAIRCLQQAFERLKTSGDEKRLAKAAKALDELSDDEALNSFRSMLSQVLQRLSPSCRLFSQNLSDGRWEQTGFFVDATGGYAAAAVAGGVTETTGAISRTPWQPIGYLNEDYYVPTDSSKLLWSRAFAIGLLAPYPPAFKVELRDIPVAMANAPMTQKQLGRAEELIQTLESDLHELAKLEVDDVSGRAKKFDEMVTAMEVASLALKSLDELLAKIRTDHPEVGDRFQNANVADLALAVNQFLRERVAQDSAILRQATTELVVDSEPRQLAEQLLAAVERELQASDIPDHSRAASLISQFQTIYPQQVAELHTLAETGNDSRAQLEWIRNTLKSLSS